jgi:hypothetical protein
MASERCSAVGHALNARSVLMLPAEACSWSKRKPVATSSSACCTLKRYACCATIWPGRSWVCIIEILVYEATASRPRTRASPQHETGPKFAGQRNGLLGLTAACHAYIVRNFRLTMPRARDSKKNGNRGQAQGQLGFEAQLWAAADKVQPGDMIVTNAAAEAAVGRVGGARRRPTHGGPHMSAPSPIPTGLSRSAQGCRVRAATAVNLIHYFPRPQRGCINGECAGGFNPFRVVKYSERFPRVARASQPWAECRHPVGGKRIPHAGRAARCAAAEAAVGRMRDVEEVVHNPERRTV